MNLVTVVDGYSGNIQNLISETVYTFTKKTEAPIASLSVSSTHSLAQGISPDLLVISDKVIRKSNSLPKAKCNMLLIPETAQKLTADLQANCVVSYGRSEKNHITLSSIDTDRVVLSVQHELPTLNGGILEPQDIPIQKNKYVSPEDAMASAAALLLAGIPPECFTQAQNPATPNL